MKTMDGVLHKVNIIDNEEHEVLTIKKNTIFVMRNSGREFYIACKDAKQIDY
jgi:hypothetical protein